jgi:OCT family organic cation transporter-like MFS transporter 4/5
VFFTNKKILGRILVSILQWTTNPFVYYGLSLSTDVLGGNPYLNYLLSSIVELAGALACQYFLQKVGRTRPYFINFLMVAVSLIAIGFVPENMTWLIVILFLVGKFSISFNFNAIYIITAESYPTIIRNSIMSVCSASGRIGAMLSPYVSLLAAYWTPLPFVLFGACSAFAGILDFLIRPETKDVDLPESLADIIPSSSHVKKNKEFELQHQQSNDS